MAGVRPHVYGHVIDKSREGAIMTHMCVSERLRIAEVSHVTCFGDLKAAFYSLSNHALQEAVNELVTDAVLRKVAFQRVSEAHFQLQCGSADVDFYPGCGALLGGPFVARACRVAFFKAFDRLLEAVRGVNFSDWFEVNSPTGESVNLAFAVYADDSAKKTVFPPCSSIDRVRNDVNAEQDIFRVELSKSGLLPADGKQKHVLELLGEGAGGH